MVNYDEDYKGYRISLDVFDKKGKVNIEAGAVVIRSWEITAEEAKSDSSTVIKARSIIDNELGTPRDEVEKQFPEEKERRIGSGQLQGQDNAVYQVLNRSSATKKEIVMVTGMSLTDVDNTLERLKSKDLVRFSHRRGRWNVERGL
tara:strand:- start:1476 stop:1913 length:438 start_codon:yes stop_codon:yes gene_type:complete